MAKYRVLVPSFIGGTLVQPGEVVEYEGETAENLEPLKQSRASKQKDATDAADSDSGNA